MLLIRQLPMLSALVLVACSSAVGQIFPTLDPNASPPVTQHVTPPPAAPVPRPPDTVSTPQKLEAKPVVQSTSNPPVAFPAPPPEDQTASVDAYVLGPQDTLTVRVVNMEELGDDAYPIDLSGYLTLPRIGRVHVAGLTIQQLQALLTQKCQEYIREPVVTISVAEFHSQPVSILGAVETPGVHQIRGNKTLFEVISEAGGLKDDAGNTITITRQMAHGAIPLPTAKTDPSGRYSIAELNIRSVMAARSPEENIPVKPYDVITVPKADLIYVIGAVKRPGGFPLQERANMTVLEALSLSQGLDKAAASKRAKILRTNEVTHARLEIPIDVQKILDGKGSDQPLLSNDILFIPTSAAKQASLRALEAIIQTGTGIAIYRP